jgi:hypothetical protein
MTTEAIEVTRVGRLWGAHRRGRVAVFSGAHAQGATRREAVAELAKMVASLRQEGRLLARRKWVKAITDAKLRDEAMRLVLARGVVDARDFNPKDRKRLAKLDAESSTAIEAVRAGKVGPRVLATSKTARTTSTIWSRRRCCTRSSARSTSTRSASSRAKRSDAASE